MSEKLSEILLKLILWFYHVPLMPFVETAERCRVVVLAPHVDDETIGCGGVIRQHSLRGDDVTVIFMTDGSRSSQQMMDLVQRREAEGRKAVGQILGVDRLLFWRYPDRRLSTATDASARLITTIKELETDILYVPSAWDLHPDHVATAKLADAAASYVRQTIRIYEIFCPLSPKLLNRCVDISNVYDVKKQATQAFTTQHVSFSSALLLNRVQSELVHQPNIRAVEGFLEISPAQYPYVDNLLATAKKPPRQVLNYRNVLYAYLTNLLRAESIANQINKS